MLSQFPVLLQHCHSIKYSNPSALMTVLFCGQAPNKKQSQIFLEKFFVVRLCKLHTASQHLPHMHSAMVHLSPYLTVIKVMSYDVCHSF